MSINIDTGNLVAQGFTTLASTLIAQSDAKRQEQLEKYIAKLSSEQKAQLEYALLKEQSLIQRQQLLFQAMALDNQNKLQAQTKRQLYKSLTLPAVALLSLVALIIFRKKQ